jgi:hypothetical protein
MNWEDLVLAEWGRIKKLHKCRMNEMVYGIKKLIITFAPSSRANWGTR